MLVTLSGINTEVSALQEENAHGPMLVTWRGMFIEARDPHAEKACLPIAVTLPSSGIGVSAQPRIKVFAGRSIKWPPFTTKLGLSSETVISVRLLQPSNGSCIIPNTNSLRSQTVNNGHHFCRVFVGVTDKNKRLAAVVDINHSQSSQNIMFPLVYHAFFDVATKNAPDWHKHWCALLRKIERAGCKSLHYRYAAMALAFIRSIARLLPSHTCWYIATFFKVCIVHPHNASFSP